MGFHRTKNAIRNIAVGLLNRVVLLICPFIVRTVMIYTLGTEYLGISSLFTSLLTILSVAELGFGSALVYSMYKPLAEGDTKTVNQLLNFYKNIYRKIGILIAIVGILFLPFLKHIISGEIPSDVNIYILYIVYLVNTCVSYWLFAYKSSILTINQRLDIKSNIDTCLYVIQYIIQIVMLVVTRNYYLYLIIQPIITILDNLGVAIITKKKYPEYKGEGKIDPKLRKDLLYKTGALVGNKIGNTIITSADNIVISAFLGLIILGRYNNYYYIMYTLITLMSIIYFALLPSVGNSIATESIQKNYKDFKIISFFNSWIFGWWSICLICLYQNFIELWVGTENQLDMIMVILFVADFYFWKSYDNISLYKDASGMWSEDKLRPYIAAVFNLVVNIILVNVIGIYGILISTILSIVMIHIPWATRVLFLKYFKVEPWEFYTSQFIHLVVVVLGAIITYKVCSFVQGNNVICFIQKVGISAIIPNLLFVTVYFRTNEFKCLLQVAKNYVIRYK